MLYIIHGDDTVSSRKKVDELISEDKWIVRFDGKEAESGTIQNSLSSQELFSDGKAIVVENFLELGSTLATILPVFNTYTADTKTKIVLWQGKEVDKRTLKKLTLAKEFLFPLPKYYFSFLDSLTPRNSKKLHDLLEKLALSLSAEQIFYSLVKRIRILIMIKTGKSKEFADIVTMAPWQLTKLSQQASAWNIRELIALYQKFFELEVGLKTNALPLPLLAHLDLLLIKEV